MQRRRSRFGRNFLRLLLLVLAAVVLGIFGAIRVGPPPTVSIEPRLPGIGKKTAIDVRAEEPKRGLAGLSVEFVQGERVEVLATRAHTPRPSWAFWGPRQTLDTLTVEVGTETLKGLKEGPAKLRVVAQRAGSWLRSPAPVVVEKETKVRLRPPSVQVVSSRTYVDQGGSEAVVYRVSDSSVKDGVQAGSWWFPGFPLPGGGAQDRFALFGVPFDLSDVSAVRLVAEDDVGNVARASFIDRFRPRPFKTDTIQVSDAFLERVVPPILDHEPDLGDKGSLLDNYLMINGDLRRKNAQTLLELSQKSEPKFLWAEVFVPMRNAQVMSNFADRRTYIYQGRSVDRQDHLGFDLASTSLAEVQAGNAGVVVLARFFGIYGNTVIVDHGYGLQTLYGHLSSIAVEEGQKVAKGQVVGRSGETGLAGGDHLHFSVLLHGLSVNPSEWWDSHWIHDRLKLKLGAALP
jgi:murein DD-endopeptidase MepM/ murein hydrolase activator NlpD